MLSLPKVCQVLPLVNDSVCFNLNYYPFFPILATLHGEQHPMCSSRLQGGPS